MIRLTPGERKVFEALEVSSRGLVAQRVADETEISVAMVHSHLRALLKKGMVRRDKDGPNRSFWWWRALGADEQGDRRSAAVKRLARIVGCPAEDGVSLLESAAYEIERLNAQVEAMRREL